MNVLIIGGSTDIGISLANYFLGKGYNVIVSYCRHKLSLSNIEVVKCDVRSENDIDKVIKSLVDKYGKIDILINMAAISIDSYYQDKTKEEFMHVLEVNLVGSFLVNKVYSKYISNGIVVNIASTDGINTGSLYNIDYSASKAGIINMTKIMAHDGKNKIICICPNWLDSISTREMNMTYLNSELKRIGQSRLITLDEFNDSVYGLINDSSNGIIYRLDIKGDKLWIEKI